jgi:hypothetical protein
MSRFIISILHKILFKESNNEICGVCSMHGETQTERPFGRPRYRRVGNIKADLQERGWQIWIELIWLRTGTCGRATANMVNLWV